MGLTDLTMAWVSYPLATGVALLVWWWCVRLYCQSAQRGHDIQQQREQQKQTLLSQAQSHARLVEEVVTAMHQPMQGVIELHQAMSTRNDLSPEVRLYLKHAHDAVVHLQTVVGDLLDPMHNMVDNTVLSLRVTWAPCAVRQVVQQAFDLFDLRCRHLGLAYHCQIDDAVPEHVITDAHRLRQVLINLLGNAVKFTSAGQISLHVSANAQQIQFVVEDTGIGIADPQQAKIFERFTQAHDTHHHQSGGHGLGLAISHQVVAQLGGALTVVSELGRGSRFMFALPLQAPVSAS
jgi:signal transduction histidine kinase